MPYQATVYNVMIASPSDVESERKLAREVIFEWNSLHSKDKNIVLMPIGWDTHTAPEMGAHPQIIIDKQILRNADLLVGIFLHRLGTPTLDAQSGTAHEIDSHTSSGKPAMIYFLEEKVDPSKFDTKQYEKLMTFKEDMKKKGLLHECNRDEFRDKFFKHLTITVNENEYIQNKKLEIKISNFGDFNDTSEIEISDEAKTILLEAVNDKNGHIFKLRHTGGTSIATNGHDLIPDNNSRTIAKWEYALSELVSNDFVEERGYKGEVFAVTHKGYEYADTLKKGTSALQDTSSSDASALVQQDDLQFERRSGTFVSKTSGIRYCQKCYYSTPSKRVELQESPSGWSCSVCGKFYDNPDFNPPEQSYDDYNPLDIRRL